MAAFTRSDDITIVANMAPRDKALESQFRSLASNYRDLYSFAIGSPANDKQSVVSCYNNVDDEQFSTTELAAAKSLENFIKLCTKPLIPELTRRNEIEYLNVRSRCLGLIFICANTVAEWEESRSFSHLESRGEREIH